MKYLILADIHANMQAFQAVLDHAEGRYDKVLFLGDLANFGPNPCECARRLRALDPICVMGNHDGHIAVKADPRHPWNEWSRGQLDRELLSWMASFRPYYILDNTVLLIHGFEDKPDCLPSTLPETFTQMLDSYFKTASQKVEIEHDERFRELLDKRTSIRHVWFGHYHYEIDAISGGVRFCGIRAVGQQRDRDPRASYAIYDSESKVLERVRVPYAIEETLAQLDSALNDFDDPSRFPLTHERLNSFCELRGEFKKFVRDAFHEKFLEENIDLCKEHLAERKKRGMRCEAFWETVSVHPDRPFVDRLQLE